MKEIIDVRTLRALLKELRANGVTRFKAGTVELEIGQMPVAIPATPERRMPDRGERLPTSWADLEIESGH